MQKLKDHSTELRDEQLSKRPATPTNLTTSCDEEFRANAEEGAKHRAEMQHRILSYPKMLEALRKIAKPALGGKQQQWIAQQILKELGESRSSE